LLFRRKKEPVYKLQIWDYGQADFNAFKIRLSGLDWNSCFDLIHAVIAVLIYLLMVLHAASLTKPLMLDLQIYSGILPHLVHLSAKSNDDILQLRIVGTKLKHEPPFVSFVTIINNS